MGCCGRREPEESKDALTGPTEKRECRDIIWLLVFIVFWAGMFIIAGFAFKNGDWKRLVYGTDSFGNVCGENNVENLASVANSGLDLSNAKYLYYQSATTSGSTRLCVNACPSMVTSCSVPDSTACRAAGVCFGGVGSPYSSLTNGDSDCGLSTYASSGLLHIHRCTPTDASLIANFYDDLNEASDTLGKVLADFANGGLIILWCVLITMGLAIVVIVLMHFFPGIIIWTLVMGGALALAALTVFLWVQWSKAKKRDQALETNGDDTKLFQALMIIALVLTLIVFQLVLVLRKRINLCITIFKEASRAMARMPQMFISPFLNYLALGMLFAYWIWVYMYLATSGTLEETSTHYVRYVQKNADYRKMWWYHLFGLLWTSQFFLACGQLTLASMTALWYFSRDKSDLSWPLSRSIWRVFRYHLGSVIFGAFIIALVQLARIILNYIQAKLKKRAGKIVSCLLCCLSCCLWCFEKCLKFLNKNAYIEIAIYGSNFCVAAVRAFVILIENVLRVAVINSIGTFVLFMLKLFIVCSIGILALAWLRTIEGLNFIALVVLVIVIFAYFLADLFLDLYKMTIDTIFLCFCEDSKMNNGKDKPYFMSDSLLSYMSSNVPEKMSYNGADNAAQLVFVALYLFLPGVSILISAAVAVHSIAISIRKRAQSKECKKYAMTMFDELDFVKDGVLSKEELELFFKRTSPAMFQNVEQMKAHATTKKERKLGKKSLLHVKALIRVVLVASYEEESESGLSELARLAAKAFAPDNISSLLEKMEEVGQGIDVLAKLSGKTIKRLDFRPVTWDRFVKVLDITFEKEAITAENVSATDEILGFSDLGILF